MEKIKFAKVNPNGIIPSKRDCDGGYDVYACFGNDHVIIEPQQTVMIPTGIASSFSSNYCFLLEERGSTGTRAMSRRSGLIDSNYRGEWNVVLNNTGYKTICISKTVEEVEEYETIIHYPYSKAICQALFLPVPKTEIEEIPYDELKLITSVRGDNKLGSSGK